MTTIPKTASLISHLHRWLGRARLEPTPDAALVHRFVQDRDDSAFAALVDRHGPMVLGVARRVIGDYHLAEDVFQATFLTLARRAGHLRRPASLPAWLHRTACNLAVTALRARKRRDLVEAAALKPVTGSPLDDLSFRELLAILDEELRLLPEAFRLPLVLCCLEGRSQDEAAKLLGWTRGSVKGRLERGRRRLKNRLTRRGLTLPMALATPFLIEGAAPAAVLPTLARATVQAALAFSVGRTTAGVVSTQVAALVERGLKAMFVSKLKLAGMFLLALSVLAAGAGLAAYHGLAVKRAQDQQGQASKRPVEHTHPLEPERQKQARTDHNGEALPQGALYSFGSARLRHGGVIWASALSPDGKLLATAGDHSVMVWNLDTGKALHHFGCDRDSTFCDPGLSFSPDGTRLGYVRGRFFACIWDLQTGKEIRRFERRFEDGYGKWWNGRCQFANQGKQLVLCTAEAIQTWNVESGQLETSIPAEADVLSPDARTYLHLEAKTGLTLGDAGTGKKITRLAVAAQQNGAENGLAFSPDGKTLAIVHERKDIQLRRVVDSKVLASFPLPESAQLKVSGDDEKYWQYRVAFSTDGKTLLLGTSGGLIHRWDLAAGKELPPLSKHYRAVAGMHTLPDGRTLVSTGEDGVIRRWNLQTGREATEPESYQGRSQAAYSLDGRFAAIGDARGRLDLWDGRCGKLVRTLQQEGDAVAYLAFAPNGKLLAVAERSGTVRFWQVPSGRPGPVWQREPTTDELYCDGLQFNPNGCLLCVSDYPKQIRVVEVASGKLLWTGEGACAEAFSPDGATLLVAANGGPYLTVFDATTGKKRLKVRLNSNAPDNFGIMSTVACSPDGRRLAVALQGGTLMLCNGHTCAETQCLADHDLDAERQKAVFGGKMANQIRALAFSPDGKWFASAGSDATVYIWETATGKEVLRLSGHEAEVSSVAFTPDGRTVFSYGQDGQGYLWDLRPRSVTGLKTATESLWTDLAAPEAAKAYRAVWAMSGDAEAASGLLRQKIAAVKPVGKESLVKLIADLGSDRFRVREAATQALAEIGDLAAPALKEALKADPSLEVRQRLRGLLDGLEKKLPPVELRRMRAVQVLELAATAEACQVLRGWAAGAPGARLTQDAKAALERLAKRLGSPGGTP